MGFVMYAGVFFSIGCLALKIVGQIVGFETRSRVSAHFAGGCVPLHMGTAYTHLHTHTHTYTHKQRPTLSDRSFTILLPS